MDGTHLIGVVAGGGQRGHGSEPFQHVRFKYAHLHFQARRQGLVGQSVDELDVVVEHVAVHYHARRNIRDEIVGDQKPVVVESPHAEVHHPVNDLLIVGQVVWDTG